jgi:hypothetical protein
MSSSPLYDCLVNEPLRFSVGVIRSQAGAAGRGYGVIACVGKFLTTTHLVLPLTFPRPTLLDYTTNFPFDNGTSLNKVLS